jgi:predicted RNA-binding Zn-ribbon protein involved in translation (DUF1610 family)
MIAIAVLFLVPIYYIAKSKGYNATWVCVVSAALGAAVPLAFQVLGRPLLFPVLDFTPSLLVLIVVWLIPPREGAPGKAYLKISFLCPECGESIVFPREREGTADLCPKCGELIRIPEDEHSPDHSQQNRTRPTASHGVVCFESFGRPEPAQVLAAILSDNGVAATVSGDSGGGVLPQVGNTQGHRVMIDVTQWDEAVRIEKECQQSVPQL